MEERDLETSLQSGRCSTCRGSTRSSYPRSRERRSMLSTYLTTVVQRALLDYVNSQWGKWRPSARANREGPLAVKLEKLLVCDRLSLGEACQVLRTEEGVEESEDA